jgi:hypothetical protein
MHAHTHKYGENYVCGIVGYGTMLFHRWIPTFLRLCSFHLQNKLEEGLPTVLMLTYELAVS